MNTLYYGDNLLILRNYIKDESIDLIYLDPPFNSKATYNILYKEPNGSQSRAQIAAFEDTWHWTEETEKTYQEIIGIAPANVIEMMRAFRLFIGNNDMMAYLTMMCIRLIELKRVLKETGSIYLHCDPTASHYLKILMDQIFGKYNIQNEIIWCFKSGGASSKYFARKHQIILFYSKAGSYYFNAQEEKSYMGEDYNTGNKNVTLYDDHDGKGKYTLVNMKDWWLIPMMATSSKERLKYPTQKPPELLRRIITASSKEGDIILDPFCGCGTTTSVAQRLKRQWVGIDITHLAINLIKWRMKHEYSIEAGKDYKVIGEPEDLEGAKQLASENRYQFQWWATSLVNARPYHDKKKGADSGIDGYIYFSDEKNKVKHAIVQVKSGGVGVKDIRDLSGVIDREKAEIGIFVTLEEPTKPMETEAVSKGFYESETLHKKFRKIDILTIKDLLEGKKTEIDPYIPVNVLPYKIAERYQENTQIELLEDNNEEESETE